MNIIKRNKLWEEMYIDQQTAVHFQATYKIILYRSNDTSKMEKLTYLGTNIHKYYVQWKKSHVVVFFQ